MPLSFNFGDKLLPRMLRRVYEYGPLLRNYELTMSDRSTIRIDVKKQIEDAWKYLENNCGRSGSCNDYFASLSKGKTLKDLMTGTNFVMHRIQPVNGHTEDQLPWANAAGTDIGISIYTFVDTKDNSAKLAAVLLHEIAHFGGATTNPDSRDALAAETSLIKCGLRQFYSPDSKG